MEINVNDRVKVRLTAFGEAVLARHKLKQFEFLGGSLDPHASENAASSVLLGSWEAYGRDAEGMRTFQLYELMEIFGPVMTFTAQQMPFRNNRIVLAEDSVYRCVVP